MKRPETNDYYWYRKAGGEYKDWKPVEFRDGWVLFIGRTDEVSLQDLDGVFVKMGRPIPFMGTITPEGLVPPTEKDLAELT